MTGTTILPSALLAEDEFCVQSLFAVSRDEGVVGEAVEDVVPELNDREVGMDRGGGDELCRPLEEGGV
jgi:hypothetical protein